MKYKLYFWIIVSTLALSGCTSDETSHYDRTRAEFSDSFGGEISETQWWKTAVKLEVNVTTDIPVKLLLLSSEGYRKVLYDYRVLSKSGVVTMTAPQGQGNTLYLRYIYNDIQRTKSITLTGKSVETVYIETSTRQQAMTRVNNPPASLCGNSIEGDAKYYQFTNGQLKNFFAWMSTNTEKVDAKLVDGQICNYELESNGPFYITWVTGNESDQRSHILGYFYHSPTTYDDIEYVDMSETHKWDYIDGFAKVQYQISKDERIVGKDFWANTWYDANFDMSDIYGATKCNNMDRVGDDAYNMHTVYNRFTTEISALRGISFKIDVPEGKRVGFYLRSDEEPLPEQWDILRANNIRPYVSKKENFMGTCFCVEDWNIVGNGKGKHRSFIKTYDEVYWMGMEDILEGGDHDCNDVIFGVSSDMKIWMPTIIDPELQPEVGPDTGDYTSFPWTIAYEDVNRNPDFDFNDAVIKLQPDYENELCCVTVMAAGSTSRMYLHYDGPDGDQNLGEIHDLLDSNLTYVNTKGAMASTPFTQVNCVPWPKGYTMGSDAQRFYIEIQRGDCNDCTDVITLAMEPGIMPEALLVAGEWQWPMEGVHIFDCYDDFSKWGQDETRTRFWEWYKKPKQDTYVAY